MQPLVIAGCGRLQPPPSDWAERGSPSGNAVGPLIPVISAVPMETRGRFSQTNNGRMFICGRTEHSGRSACLPLSPDSQKEVGWRKAGRWCIGVLLFTMFVRAACGCGCCCCCRPAAPSVQNEFPTEIPHSQKLNPKVQCWLKQRSEVISGCKNREMCGGSSECVGHIK